MAFNEADILRELEREESTNERIRMIQRVQRRRSERARTLGIRAARVAKYAMQGRI